MSKSAKPQSADFIATLEEALKNYPDSAWLGQHSPLATPYLLGSRLPAQEATAPVRGQTLRDLLRESASEITGKYGERYQAILQEYYFAGRTALAAADIIGLGKNRFHQARRAAIAALEKSIIRQLRPALRLENPPTTPKLVGRAEELTRCISALNKNESSVIAGSAGTGKTALLAQIAKSWSTSAYWQPLRLHVNDHPESLLFSFGLFMHHLGSSTLWQEMVASPAQVDLHRALAIIRYMVEQANFMPLICIDNCEILTPDQKAHHRAYCELLQGISDILPICAGGQQVPLDFSHYIQLGSLQTAESISLLEALLDTSDGYNRQSFSRRDLTKIHTYTGGNPRLLTLCITYLLATDEKEPFEQLRHHSPAVESLLDQIVAQLTEAEQRELYRLSVFRTPVPLSILEREQQNEGRGLPNRHQLFQVDSQGGIEVVPIYRQHLYHNLPDVTRRLFHQAAAELRQTFAAYTAAAYHFIQADMADVGLWKWKERRDQELAQGQAQAALSLFDNLRDKARRHKQEPKSTLAVPTPDDVSQSESALSLEGQELLAIICSDLERFVGNLESARNSIQQTARRHPVLSVEANELDGIISNDESRFEDANRAFQLGLQTAEALIETRMASIHKGLGWMHFRQRELAIAERHLNLAHFEVENMRGNLAFQRCDYQQATVHYKNALVLATEEQLTESEAKATNNLATIYLMNGDFEQCSEQLEKAITLFEGIGKLTAMIGSKITRSVAYNQAGRHGEALKLLNEVDQDFSSAFEPAAWLVALQQQAVAEAHLGLEHYEQAEVCVQAVIAAEEVDLLPDAYRTLGEIWMAQGKFAEAKEIIQQSLDLAVQNTDSYLVAYAWRALGRLHLASGQTEKGVSALLKANEQFQEMNLEFEVGKTTDLLNTVSQ